MLESSSSCNQDEKEKSSSFENQFNSQPKETSEEEAEKLSPNYNEEDSEDDTSYLSSSENAD